jgi:hypothetical protein
MYLQFISTSACAYVYSYYGRQHEFLNRFAVQNNRIEPFTFGKSVLTETGKELFPITGSKPNEEYRDYVVTTFREKGWEVAEDPAISSQ